MAVRGNKPKPTVLKDLHGSKKPRNPLEPKPAGDLAALAPPDFFTDDQVSAWNFALDHSPPGMLKQIDRSALTVWVIASDLHRKACIAQSRTGLVVRSPQAGVPVQSPYLPVINRQAVVILRAAAELGFTPAARPRLSLQGAAGGRDLGGQADAIPQTDTLEAYLARDPGSSAVN
jgi:P27 family predicted phage terminase small subunit